MAVLWPRSCRVTSTLPEAISNRPRPTSPTLAITSPALKLHGSPNLASRASSSSVRRGNICGPRVAMVSSSGVSANCHFPGPRLGGGFGARRLKLEPRRNADAVPGVDQDGGGGQPHDLFVAELSLERVER